MKGPGVSSREKDEVPVGAGISSRQPGDRVGEYVLEEPIGEGGCGVVWRARHAVLPGVVVAIKMPRDPQLIGLLRRESLLQHGLDHPGVLKVLGVDLDADVPYVVQEYAAGGDLAQLIGRRGKLSSLRALEIFTEVVEIVAHAHANGVVHCDLKPGNILLDDQGRVRISDFGLGKFVETLTASVLRESLDTPGPRTGGRHLGGTWEYMAPEVKEGKVGDTPDPRVDVFALGIVLYEMLTGSRPAGRVNLKHFSEDLDTLFARCWTSSSGRYADAGELLADLRRLAGKKPLARQPLGVQAPPGPARRSRLRWFVWGYVVPLSLLAAAVALVWLGERSVRLADSALHGVVSDDAAAPLFPEAPRDEADELAEIRRRIETQPFEADEAASLLREFRARARDPRLQGLAKRWEKILPGGDEPRDYVVRWKRYRLDKEAYREKFNLTLEPGRPDVYLNVYCSRGGREQLIYTSAGQPVEGWSHDWTRSEGSPSFTLRWAKGDALRMELWESDVFGDDVIAEYRLDGELSILLVSTMRRSDRGHAVELESDFAFGK